MTDRQEAQKKKPGKNKGIFILAAVLVILLAVYFGLRAWNQNEEKQQEEAEKEAQIHVTDTESRDITAMSFDVGNGELSFSKEGGAWKYTPDEDFPLDQSYPKNMASVLGDITADRELEDGDSLADYGLDEPVYTLSFTDKEENITGNIQGSGTFVKTGDGTVNVSNNNSSFSGSCRQLLCISLISTASSVLMLSSVDRAR